MKSTNTPDKPLDARLKLFVATFLANGRKGSDAAEFVGIKKASAPKVAHRWVHLPNVMAAISLHDAALIKGVKKIRRGEVVWKRRKLMKIIDELSKYIDDKTAKPIIAAISELNKMDGHYSAEKIVNLNIDGDKDLEAVKAASANADEVMNKYRSDY